MTSIVKKTLALIVLLIFMIGCEQQEKVVVPKQSYFENQKEKTLDDVILDLANQLASNNQLFFGDSGSISLTSFVNLDDLNTTSKFGRIIEESLLSELFIRQFNIVDFRGQGVISINRHGEFFITRDPKKLKGEITNSYVLIGTYSHINDYVMINTRIVDNQTGNIVSSARAMYKNYNCNLLGTCRNLNRTIKIVSATNIPKTFPTP